jgi:hypothetical protein
VVLCQPGRQGCHLGIVRVRGVAKKVVELPSVGLEVVILAKDNREVSSA